MPNKPTLVIGASTNPERYSNLAIHKLLQNKHTVYAIGAKAGNVGDVVITTEKKLIENVDTVTLYINPTLQETFYEYILQLKPNRIIFNPGTENADLFSIATNVDINCINACTLVMLSSKQF